MKTSRAENSAQLVNLYDEEGKFQLHGVIKTAFYWSLCWGLGKFYSKAYESMTRLHWAILQLSHHLSRPFNIFIS